MPRGWGPLWFLPHLWAVCFFSYLFLRALGYEKKTLVTKSIFLVLLLLFGYFTIGLLQTMNSHIVIASKALIGTLVTKQGTVIPNVVGVITSIDSGAMPRYTPLNGLPFSLDIVCLTAFYFLCGFTIRQYVKEIHNINNKGLLLFIATSVFSALNYFFNYTNGLNDRIYDNLFVCTAEVWGAPETHRLWRHRFRRKWFLSWRL